MNLLVPPSRELLGNPEHNLEIDNSHQESTIVEIDTSNPQPARRIRPIIISAPPRDVVPEPEINYIMGIPDRPISELERPTLERAITFFDKLPLNVRRHVHMEYYNPSEIARAVPDDSLRVYPVNPNDVRRVVPVGMFPVFRNVRNLDPNMGIYTRTETTNPLIIYQLQEGENGIAAFYSVDQQQ